MAVGSLNSVQESFGRVAWGKLVLFKIDWKALDLRFPRVTVEGREGLHVGFHQ